MCKAMEELIEEARKEGIEEARTENIRRMLQRGKTPEEIANFCEYDLEDIRAVAGAMLTTV
jgi:predicted transposase YdaD